MYLNDETKFEYSDENSFKIYNFNNFETFEKGLSNIKEKSKIRIKDNLLNLLNYKKKFTKIELNEIGKY